MVLQLARRGVVFDRLVRKGRFNDTTARRYFQQLVQGVKHCHSIGVIHGDLKPENLLLDAGDTLLISDFGVATLQERHGTPCELHDACGTLEYVAPEVLSGEGYSGYASDIWSMGVTLFVFLAGKLPFHGSTGPKLAKRIAQGTLKYPLWFSASARSLISAMLDVNPVTRATVADIEAHEWMQGPTCPSSEHSSSSSSSSSMSFGRLSSCSSSGGGRMSPSRTTSDPFRTATARPSPLSRCTYSAPPVSSSFGSDSTITSETVAPPKRITDGVCATDGDVEEDAVEEEVGEGKEGGGVLSAFHLVSLLGGKALRSSDRDGTSGATCTVMFSLKPRKLVIECLLRALRELGYTTTCASPHHVHGHLPDSVRDSFVSVTVHSAELVCQVVNVRVRCPANHSPTLCSDIVRLCGAEVLLPCEAGSSQRAVSNGLDSDRH